MVDHFDFDFEPFGGPSGFLTAVEYNKNNGLNEQENADQWDLSISQFRAVVFEATKLEQKEAAAFITNYRRFISDVADLRSLGTPEEEIAAGFGMTIRQLNAGFAAAIMKVRTDDGESSLFKAPPANDVDVSLDDPDEFLLKAKRLAKDHYNSKLPSSAFHLTLNDFYIVWFSKVLQNWKALVSTNVPGDGLYYELTYNGDSHEAYVDVYHKSENLVVPD